MAQSKGGSARSGSQKSTSASGGSRSGGARPKSGAQPAVKSTARRPQAAAARPEPAAEELRQPARREVGAVLLLFFALVAFITYFDIDAWLVDIFRQGCLGLFGWGYFAVCPALLLGGCILAFHRGRPVTARLVCALFLPLVFGAFVHIALCGRVGFLVGNLSSTVTNLWKAGLLVHGYCGGVLSGLLAEGLEYAISIYGGIPVLTVALIVLLARAMDITWASLMQASEPRRRYTREQPEETERRPSPRFFAQEELPPEPAPVPRSRFAFLDIPLDDDGPGPETLPPEKAPKPEKPPKTDAAPAPKKERKKSARPTPEFFDVEKEDELFAAKTASATDGVKPVSLEQAAAIAGVELDSAAMEPQTARKEKPKKLSIDRDAEAEKVAEEIRSDEEADKPDYVSPPLELLQKPSEAKTDSRDEVAANRERLENTIRSFGVSAHITGVTRGPTVTRFDVELDQGVKLNKLTNLAGDIALSLGVVSVRIAPIPDKISTVGVEVPNRSVTTVYLREIVASQNFEKASSKLSFAIGKDIGGNAIVGNISKLPHLLIAGTTGSGKSVCINSLILSLLYKSTPDEVRMIMIDPKMVELGIYNGMPHLYVPVVTDPKKAAGALQWSVVEMLKRYSLFSEVGVRDLTGYNNYQKRHQLPTIPQVVILIDELADLMLVASKEVEESICRVAQMGRASGMHLVIATQRPSADVITGLMKANIPSRIAFAVSSSLESRIIMDQSGAEKLIGQGDMLYCPLGIGKPMRVQGAFVSDEEREAVVEFVKKDAEAAYSDEILAEIERAAAAKGDKGSKNSGGDGDESDSGDPFADYDALLTQAVDVAFELGSVSVSSLQRRLKLGYSRAARIVDQMEELGVVGPPEGSKPRKLLLSKTQWQEMQYATGVAPPDTIAGEFAEVADDARFAELPEDGEADE